MAVRPKLLIFEPDIEGHPREWIDHIVRYAVSDQREYQIYLLLSPTLDAEFRSAYPDISPDRVRSMAISASEHRLCVHRWLLVSAMARWRVMRRYAERLYPDYIHFQSIDHLALPLAIGFSVRNGSISGILFRPSIHYREFDHRSPRLKEHLRDLRKSLLYRRMLAHPQLRRIYSLDPYFPAFASRRDVNGSKVRPIPDPAPNFGVHRENIESAGPLYAGRTTFLLFGHLTKRKGLLALLDALAVLRPEAAGRIAVVLAGGVEKSLRRQVSTRLAALERDQPDLIVDLEDRRLPEAELQALIGRSDIVLAPYQRFVGSSGVLLWAARAGKPVIAQDYGLVGRLVRDHGLGVVIDTTDHRILAQTLEWSAVAGSDALIDRAGAIGFVDWQTPEVFAATILEDVADQERRQLLSSENPFLAPA